MSYQDERLYERQLETGWAEDCEHTSPACEDCGGNMSDESIEGEGWIESEEVCVKSNVITRES